MSDGDAKRSHVRIAAAILAALVLAAAVFTYLAYTAAFTSTDTVTSPRAGLVMERDAKVKYRGIQIGEVKSIDYWAWWSTRAISVRCRISPMRRTTRSPGGRAASPTWCPGSPS